MVGKFLSQLNQNEKGSHLILARVFSEIFGRKLRNEEWGWLRRLIKLYGSETVFWALLSSVGISNTNKPLAYVSKICINWLADGVEEAYRDTANNFIDETQELLLELRGENAAE